MRWPWWRRETRSDSYTDELVRALQSRAGVATLADELHTLSLEASAGTVGRGFAAATVGGGAGPELEPHLEAIGRAFVRRGESVLVPRRGGFFALASHWTVEGRSRPWTYEVTISEPDGQITFRLPERRVLHFRTNVARAAPWRGRGPLEVATAGGKLMANLEAALADETGGPRGSILPVPTNPDEATMGTIRNTIRDLAGRVFIAESQRTNWNDADARQVTGDWTAHRLGANPPEALVRLMVEHRRAVLAAAGVPPEILGGSDSAGRREAFRIFAWGTLAPLGYIVSREIDGKLGISAPLKWDRLRASDVTGRARAYKGLVEAGMNRARAETLVGFEG